jgi:hypothetical protein
MRRREDIIRTMQQSGKSVILSEDVITKWLVKMLRSDCGILDGRTGYESITGETPDMEIRNLVSVRFQAGFNACTTSLHFSPVREKDWRARASRAKPLFEIISSQIDILRKSHCVSKCMRKSHSVSNCMRKSHYISK